VPDDAKGQKANLFVIKNHHKRCIRKYYTWLDGMHRETLWGKLKRKGTKSKLYLEFRPLTKVAFERIRDARPQDFDFIERNNVKYIKLLTNAYNPDLTVAWTEADMTFMMEYENTAMPIQYAMLGAMLAECHTELDTPAKQMAAIRMIATHEHMDNAAWRKFWAELSTLIIPDDMDVYRLRNLAKDKTLMARLRRDGQKLYETDDLTLLQDIFLSIAVNETETQNQKAQDAHLAEMIKAFVGGR
jgi:hypothetical protein